MAVQGKKARNVADMRAVELPNLPTNEPRSIMSLPKSKHAAEHNVEPAPLMVEHAWLRSATTRYWH